jgi:hypothetical protein
MQHSKASAPATKKRTSPASFRAKQAKHIKNANSYLFTQRPALLLAFL